MSIYVYEYIHICEPVERERYVYIQLFFRFCAHIRSLTMYMLVNFTGGLLLQALGSLRSASVK